MCKATLLDNRPLLDDVTDALIEEETVDFEQLNALVGKYHAQADSYLSVESCRKSHKKL